MIHINRKIFLALNKETELQEAYIKDCIDSGYPEEHLDYEVLVDTITNIILRNELIISKYGWESYIEEDYPAKDHCSGYGWKTGKIAVIPFDWSADTEDELNYSFVLSRII